MRLPFANLAAGVLVLSACSTNPAPVRSALPVGAHYHAPTTAGAMPAWRQMLPDPALQQLVERALANNRDLREAALQVAAVQAQYQLQEAARQPVLEASANATRQRQASADAPRGAISQQRSVGVGISAFELDLFGRLRSQSEAALARYLASVEGQRAVRLALIAAVADAYLDLRLAEDQARLTSNTLRDWRLAQQLTERLYAAQQRSGLDVAQAAGQVASAEADLQARERAVQLARHQLELLLGTALPDELAPDTGLAEQAVLTTLPAGLPSELLARRPDILQAEQALAAAHADIGAARAAFFPRIALTAMGGYSSADMGGLFKDSNRSWTFAPQITQPIFNRGQLRAELRLAEVRKDLAVVQYERAIQSAFREVNDALASLATQQRQMQALQQVVAHAAQRERLLTQRYQAGLDDRLELLDAQRQSYSAQSGLLDLRRAHLQSAVALYKALGGGLD